MPTRQLPGLAAWCAPLVKFCRLRLGLKPLIDHLEARHRLLGLCDLPIRTVFDIGANVGKKARFFRRKFPAARIVCVEPLPACHERLRTWAQGQNNTVTVFPVALGHQAGQATLHWNTEHWGGSTLVAGENRPTYQELQVPVETLDRLAAQVDIADDLLVKIDVEGFELEVMHGGVETLRRAAALVIELPLVDTPGRPSFASVVSFLDDLDFTFRGNLGSAWVGGIPYLTDAVFTRRNRCW